MFYLVNRADKVKGFIFFFVLTNQRISFVIITRFSLDKMSLNQLFLFQNLHFLEGFFSECPKVP